MRFFSLAVLAGSAMIPAFGADAVGQVFDQQVSTIEREVLPLVEAMPANKFDFAPTNGAFTGVRTFALQARHDATMIWRIAASVAASKSLRSIPAPAITDLPISPPRTPSSITSRTRSRMLTNRWSR